MHLLSIIITLSVQENMHQKYLLFFVSILKKQYLLFFFKKRNNTNACNRK